MSRDFLSLAHELSMLTPELIEQLSAEATRTGESPETLAARRGLLSAVQMDIVQTLLRPTEIVPGYELLTALGHGGMGVVYRARQKTLDRVVAIKTILVNQIADRSMAARFEQEARAVAKLKHPNIISAIDFGQHDGRLFFVMEFVDGEDLDSRIDHRRATESVSSESELLAWSLVRQTASGLAHAVEHGIVHHDIKPANLLLVTPPAGYPLPVGVPLVKIADFGLAFLASADSEARTRLTAANTTVGSPQYIAPEQITGEQVDQRADIYSLGATIFHLLAGQPPYPGRPIMQVLTQKMSSDAPRLRSVRADISDATDTLVARMMARRPEDRIASYSELLSLIDQLGQTLNSPTLTEIPTAALQVTAEFPRLNQSGSTTEVVGTNGSGRTLVIDNAQPARDSGTQATTLQMSAPTKTVGRSRRDWLKTAVIASASFFGSATLIHWFRRTKPVKPTLVASGWSEPLFNGRSLRNWQIRSGTWVLAEDEDGARVLAGTNGTVARRLLRGDASPPRPLMNFELSLAVRLHQAKAIEIHFGLVAPESEKSPRFVLRVETTTASLTNRTSDRDRSTGPAESVTLSATTNDQPRVIRLRRDATHWFVSIDGQPITPLKLAGTPELPEFRLLVTDGPAWFSDLEVEELNPFGQY